MKITLDIASTMDMATQVKNLLQGERTQLVEQRRQAIERHRAELAEIDDALADLVAKYAEIEAFLAWKAAQP